MGKDRAKDRLRRDQAGIGPNLRSRARLVPIGELKGYRIAEGEPDIRGWDVSTLGGRELGAVEDLLVDTERGEVVMLEVELRGEQGVHAEVPIRAVQLDRERKVVLVDSGDIADRNDVRARDRMDDEERERVRGAYADERAVSYDVDRNPRDAADVRRDEMIDDTRDTERDITADTRAAEVREEAAERERTHIDDDTEEVIVERRPVIEEVVVRRRRVQE